MLIKSADKIPYLAVVWIVLILLTVVGNWARVLVVHRRMHALYITDSVQTSGALPLDLALRAASSLIHWGAYATAATAVAALAALIQMVG